MFIGGGLGSLCRYGIATAMSQFDFPYATLLANVLACVILGFMAGYCLKNDVSSSIRLLIMTGFCGGFSTFSTFTYETFSLLQQGKMIWVLTNIIGNLLLCLCAIYVGIKCSFDY